MSEPENNHTRRIDSKDNRRSSRILAVMGAVATTVQAALVKVMAHGYDVYPGLPCTETGTLIALGVEKSFYSHYQMATIKKLMNELEESGATNVQKTIGNVFINGTRNCLILAMRSTARASAIHSAQHREKTTLEEQYLKALDDGMKELQAGQYFRAYDRYVACVGLDAEIRGVDPLHDMANPEAIPLYKPLMDWLNSQESKVGLDELNLTIDGLSLPHEERMKMWKK